MKKLLPILMIVSTLVINNCSIPTPSPASTEMEMDITMPKQLE